jgi:uncharacterized membrane protein YgcG
MWRAMTSVFIACSFLSLLISGSVLFVSPPGRVANWSNWRMIGLTKHEWSGVHTWFAVVFVLVAVFHLIFNLRPLMNYFRDRFTRRLGWRWEWVVALALCIGVFAGAQTRIPPFSSLLNWGEKIKMGWEDTRTAAPLPHAELLSLKDLSTQAKVPYETAVERLEARGFKGIRPEAIAQEIAETNQVSAQRLFEIVQGQRGEGRGAGGHGFGKAGESGTQAEKGGSHGQGAGRAGFGGGGGPGGGAGRQTLAQYCASKGILLTNATARLQAKGIKFSADRTLRDIAVDNGYDRPYGIIDIVGGAKP